MIEFCHEILFISVRIHLNSVVFITRAVIAVNFVLKKPLLVVFKFIYNRITEMSGTYLYLYLTVLKHTYIVVNGGSNVT